MHGITALLMLRLRYYIQSVLYCYGLQVLNMAYKKFISLEIVYLISLVLMVSAVCLPAVVSADLGEPELALSILVPDVSPGKEGSVTVTVMEVGGADAAKDIAITLSTKTPGVTFGKGTIEKVDAGGNATVTIPMKVDSSVKTGSYTGEYIVDYSHTGLLGIGTFSNSAEGNFTFNVTSLFPVPLSPITVIIACIVTAFVAFYCTSRRENQ